MKILCRHGYFTFEETFAGDVSRFMSTFGLSIVPDRSGIFVFEATKDAPNYSIAGNDYLGIEATKTYVGYPWEIFRENEIVYDFNSGEVKHLWQVTQLVSISKTANYYISPGLILPGSLTDGGQRVTEYAAWYSPESQRFKYSMVAYD